VYYLQKSRVTTDTVSERAVICANNNARCFPHLFYEGYGNVKICIPVTDKLFLDLAFHWTLNCTCVLQTKQGQIRLWAASHYGLRHLSYHGLRPSNLRALITACEYCEEGLLYSVDTYTFRMMCLPDKAWNMLSPQYGSPEESFSSRQ